MSTSKLHYDALRQHERWTPAHDLKLKKMIKDGKNSAEIATELGRTRAAVMNRKQVLGIAQKMTPARGSKMPYTAYDKKRTTDTGVKNAKTDVEVNGIPMTVTETPSGDDLLKAASSPTVDKKINQAIKAAKAYNKAERKEVKAMAEVSEALNKIIRNSKKKHRNEFIKALKKTNNFPLISELVR